MYPATAWTANWPHQVAKPSVLTPIILTEAPPGGGWIWRTAMSSTMSPSSTHIMAEVISFNIIMLCDVMWRRLRCYCHVQQKGDADWVKLGCTVMVVEGTLPAGKAKEDLAELCVWGLASTTTTQHAGRTRRVRWRSEIRRQPNPALSEKKQALNVDDAKVLYFFI